MAISPEEIQLDAAQQAQLAALAEKENKPWRELLQQAINSLEAPAVSKTEEKPCRRQAGHGKGKVWMAPDFDAPLEEFKDYM